MAEDKGSLYERWQYRQDMRAAGVWGRLQGLPTRDQFEHFHDAAELKSTMDVWKPDGVREQSIPELMEKVFRLSPEAQQEIHALTWKRVEQGITGQENWRLVDLYQRLDLIPQQASTLDRIQDANDQRRFHDRDDPRGFMADAAVAPAPQVYVINDALAASYRHGGAPAVVQAIEKDLHDMQVQGKVWVGDRQGNHLFDVRMGFEGPSMQIDRIQDANDRRRAEDETRASTPPPPPRGTEAYVRETVLDAIRTGYDEGYPLRSDDIRNIDRRVRESEGLAPREKSLNVGQLDTIVRREYGLDLGREEEAVNAFRMYYERHVECETGPGREQGEAQGRGR